jgi:hypothetical protein
VVLHLCELTRARVCVVARSSDHTADASKPSRKAQANLNTLHEYARKTLDKIKAEEEAYDNAHQGIHNQSGKRQASHTCTHAQTHTHTHTPHNICTSAICLLAARTLCTNA